MRTLTLLAIALFSLPSCTRYMHESRHAHRGHETHGAYDAQPVRRDRAGVIGLAIDRENDSARSVLVVARVAPGGPAADANIRPGDRIVEIEGESTRGMTEAEAARLIRGRIDTAVELRIDSPRGDRIISLVRVDPATVWSSGGKPRKAKACDRERCRRGEYRSDDRDRPCRSGSEQRAMVDAEQDGRGEADDDGGDR
jgi:hypothetical protein